MKIKLANFVTQLEQLTPGLSPRAIVEQSDHYVFKDGRIYTFNEEVMVSSPTTLKIEGTTPADQFLEQFKKFSRRYETADIRQTKNEIQTRVPNEQTGFAMSKTINLPVEEVDEPKKWKQVGQEFVEALRLVMSCASSTIEEAFMMVCLHITKDHIEACDGIQTARYTHPVPVPGDMLVRRTAIEGASGLTIEAICTTKTWFHMRTPDDLVYSCRRYVDTYNSLDKFFQTKGKKIVLPDAMGEFVEHVHTFSKQNADDYITVELSKGRMTFKTTSQGRGWHKATDSDTVKYRGPDLTFSIRPALVKEILQRGNKAMVTPKRLKVVAGNLEYLTCLGAA